MRPAGQYAAASLLVVAPVAGLLHWLLGPEEGLGVVVAAGVAYPVMVGSFALMVRYRTSRNRFLAAWIGGSLARLLILGTTAAVVMAVDALPPAVTLLALAGFFFALLLLEPVFFGRLARE